MRLRIVISEPRWLHNATRRLEEWRHTTPPRPVLRPVRAHQRPEQDTFARAVHYTRTAGRLLLRALCSLRGHDYVMKVQPRHLALHCPFCGHTTKGWHLDDAPDTSTEHRPRFLELVKRRS